MCMKIWLGVKNLVPKELPLYPAGFDRQSAAWPADETGAKLTCLDYKQKFEHERNQAAYQEILQHIKNNGSTLCPAAAEGLREILEGDLTDRVEQWVKWILKTALVASKDVQRREHARTMDGEDSAHDKAGQEDGEGGRLKKPWSNRKRTNVSSRLVNWSTIQWQK